MKQLKPSIMNAEDSLPPLHFSSLDSQLLSRQEMVKIDCPTAAIYSSWLATRGGHSHVMVTITVVIRILRMIQFNVRNSISGIYHDSNST